MAQVFVLAGAVLILFSALGVTRFNDVMAQMHFLSKATTLGIVVLLVGAALGMDSANDWTSLLLAAFLQIMTSPVSANLISRSTYLRERRVHEASESGAVDDVSTGRTEISGS